MSMVYASIYLLPASLFALGIWMVVRLLGELGFGITGRRLVFVALATLLLAPSITGTIIAVAWVPNGLFLLACEPPMLHQPRLVAFSLASFAATAVLSGIVAWLCIRRPHASAADGRLIRIGGLVAGIGILLATYYTWLPNRGIPQHVDWALIESEFGGVMDSLLETLTIDDLNAARDQRERLALQFQNDPIFSSVNFNDNRFDEGYSRPFFERRASTSYSCSGQRGGQHGLMRCTRDTGAFFDEETLKFKRKTWSHESGHQLVELEFDYEVFLDRYPGSVTYAPDAATLEQQDRQLLGKWLLVRQSEKGDQGLRTETVSLDIGPRLNPGTYAVSASVTMLSTEDPARPVDCKTPQDRCKWFETSTGTLRVRGTRVQILYDSDRWWNDRLHLSTDGMVGTDPWGDVVHFQRND